MERIGIMGGTFNPIHKGHIRLAQAAYNQYGLTKVLVIPNKLPAYKDCDELLSTSQRSDMVRLAIQPYDYMEFNDMELKRSGATYTIDTMQILHQNYPDTEFYFILGGDSLVHFQEWRKYQDILRLTTILCARRDDSGFSELEQARAELIQQVPEAKILYLDTPLFDISSTRIRDELKDDPTLSRWLPEAVYHYIREHHLYDL